MRSISADGLELIKSFEGFRSRPYQDSVGIWTIGYGHIRGVTASSPEITEAQAVAFLSEDLAVAEEAVEKNITVALNEGQYSALVSLVYNVGPSPLTHTLGALLNAGNYDGAAAEFLKWNHAGGTVIAGLTRRRESEKQLFCSLDDALSSAIA